jgi:hypothetical protein
MGGRDARIIRPLDGKEMSALASATERYRRFAFGHRGAA